MTESSSASRGLRFQARLLSFGPVMPPVGPERDQVMLEFGQAALQDSKELHLRARKALRAATRGTPTIPRDRPPIVSTLPEADSVIEERRLEWKRARQRLHDALGGDLPGEEQARQAAQRAWDALNYLEDTWLTADAHLQLHLTTELVGGIYGCHITFEDGAWWDRCISRLAHVRFGMSPGFTARRRCSLCGEDASTCSHVAGRSYRHAARRAPEGECNICHSTTCASHIVGTQHEAVARQIITDGEMHEVTFLPRPRDPLARISALEIPESQLAERAGADPARLKGLSRVLCYGCIGGCDDLRSHSEFTEQNPGPADS